VTVEILLGKSFGFLLDRKQHTPFSCWRLFFNRRLGNSMRIICAIDACIVAISVGLTGHDFSDIGKFVQAMCDGLH